MTTFKDIERGFEAKFAQDENLKFRARARCNHLLGQWAAQKLGLTGPAVEAYAKGLVMVEFEKPGADSVFTQIRADFDAKGVALSDHQIRRTMDEYLTHAISELKGAN